MTINDPNWHPEKRKWITTLASEEGDSRHHLNKTLRCPLCFGTWMRHFDWGCREHRGADDPPAPIEAYKILAITMRLEGASDAAIDAAIDREETKHEETQRKGHP